MRAYSESSRVSLEMVEGTVPVKRFWPMSLLHHHMRRLQAAGRAATLTERAQFFQGRTSLGGKGGGGVTA